MLPLYRDIGEPRLEDKGNRGLWFSRFFNQYGDDSQVPKEGKSAWVRQNARQTGEQSALLAKAIRQLDLVDALKGQARVFAGDWHFATGLGLPHPVENGLTWHPTLGVPYLTGAGVKGLVRAWVEEWDESLEKGDLRRQRKLDWFGSDDPKKPEEFRAGQFIFFDALPIAPVQLVADTMTPHMDKWYEQGREIREVAKETTKVPADWHDPVPVPFLAAKEPRLLFCIAPRHPKYEDGLDQVMEALTNALGWLGAGAKTAAGYGRMEACPKDLADLEERQRQQRSQQARVGMTGEQQRVLALEDLFKDSERQGINREPNQILNQEIGKLLNDALEWPRKDREAVAELAERIFEYLGWAKNKKMRKAKKPLIEQLRQQGESKP